MDSNLTQIKEIRKRVLRWYSKFARPLPWRGTKDPYKIWLCEIILQQTRIEQGTDYYFRFLEKFPTLRHLALADETKVLKIWEGLGYYTRARNLLKTAKIIYHQYEGKFPQTYEELLKLPGIGPYTASAIGSICFNIPVPTLDGNVRRVLSRLFEIEDTINSSSFAQKTQQIAEQLISRRSPGNFNQGLMDIGSILCTPVNPKCSTCPLKKYCLAHQHGTQALYPKKKYLRPIPLIHWLVGLMLHKNKLLITREENQNFLKNLYTLPRIEISNTHALNPQSFLLLEQEIGITGLHWNFLYTFQQKYSHKTIQFHVYRTELTKIHKRETPNSYRWVSINELKNYPFSRAFIKIIKDTLDR